MWKFSELEKFWRDKEWSLSNPAEMWSDVRSNITQGEGCKFPCLHIDQEREHYVWIVIRKRKEKFVMKREFAVLKL